MAHAVKSHGLGGTFGQLLRRFSSDGSAFSKRFADGAELAGSFAVSVPDAGLQNGRRQYVAAVKLSDFPSRHSVGRSVAVKPRLAWKGDNPDFLAVALKYRQSIGPGLFRQVGGSRGGTSVDRHHDGSAHDIHGFVVGGAGAAAPAGRSCARVS